MPYIKKERREEILAHTSQNGYDYIVVNIGELSSPGELNYALTELIQIYFLRHAQNYRAINDVLGALEGAKNEFYRRVAVPYEDKKIKENGDVFILDT